MPLLTPIERVTLEMIRNEGAAPSAAVALALGKGWATKEGAGRGKGASGKETRYSLTEAGAQALEEDEGAMREASEAIRPRRR
jgi:hypothetical protein